MADGEDTQQRILEAAGTIFAEKGFRATNVREICKLAKVHPGAVNYYFRSKEQLYVEAVRHAYQACAAEVPLPSWPEGTPPEQRLRDFIRVFLSRLMASHRFPAWYSQLVLREVSQPSEACQEFVRDFVRPTFELLETILADLLPPRTAEVRRHLISHSIIGQCLHYHHSRALLPLVVGEEEYQSYDLERLVEHITEFSLAALCQLFAARPRPRAPARGGR
jgi:AcrR family transcriptional regulator